MEKIKFYKIVSPYPEDETLNCMLTIADMDDNFLAFKDNDIKSANYDQENMTINIVRYNGENVSIDISSLSDMMDEKINEAVSGITPGIVDIDLKGELSSDGVLTLTWKSTSGESSTQISGFITEAGVTTHDESLSGQGTPEDPLRISNTEKTGKYKPVLGIVDELPAEGSAIGERWITKHKVSTFGRVYCTRGMRLIKEALANEGSPWRVPTKQDWDKLLDFTEPCSDYPHDGNEVGEYLGDIAGKVLKTVDYWEGLPNLDTYGISIVPAGFVNEGLLEGADTEARFWTDTVYPEDTRKRFIKGFSSDHNNVLQDVSNSDEWYSIRLVKDIDYDHPVSDRVSILGNTYDVVNMVDINQAWLKVNLSHNPSDTYSAQYEYDHEGIVTEKYVLNHWNGKRWEQKEFNDGDEVNVTEVGQVVTYVCVANADGNQQLVKGARYEVRNGVRRMVLDAGWY